MLSRYLLRRSGWRPLLGCRPQLPYQVADRRVGHRVELLAQQGFVNPRMLERPGPISRRRKCLHQGSRDARIERIEGREAAPPGDGRLEVIAGGRRRCEALEGLARALLQPRALGVYPSFKLRRSADEEPVEERSPIGTDRG